MSTVEVIYSGPGGQANWEFTRVTGMPLTSGTHQLPRELAERLAASSEHFAIVGGDAVTVSELRARAKAAGLTGYSGMTKPELEQALADHQTAQAEQTEGGDA